MKNLAGNDVSIFLFQFVLRANAISFVLNESIAEDMYPEIEMEIQPLAQACGETLLRYKDMCHEETIMDGNILIDECFEVMLSQGLGRHFMENEKQNLFNDAEKIANFLIEVMDRRSLEVKQGIYHEPQSVINKIQGTGTTSEGLEALGQERHELEELPWHAGVSPGLKQLKPDDLPYGVVAKRGYDHRGYCLAFSHKELGELGKIVLTGIAGDLTLMETELSMGNGKISAKKERMLQEISSILTAAITRNVKELENS